MEGRMVDGFHGTSFVDIRTGLLQMDDEVNQEEEDERMSREEDERMNREEEDERMSQLEEPCCQVWDGGLPTDSAVGVEPHYQLIQLQEMKLLEQIEG